MLSMYCRNGLYHRGISGSLRSQFRLCVLAYRCLHGSTPQYLAETLHLTSDTEACRRLRSGSTSTLFVPATRRSSLGDRAFPVAAARSWNIPGLPANSFILPNFSARTQDLTVQHFISRQLNCLCDFVKWPCSY